MASATTEGTNGGAPTTRLAKGDRERSKVDDEVPGGVELSGRDDAMASVTQFVSESAAPP